ncbi:hypothetical protein ACFL20_08490 [Spirochaetota bacterium]
MKHLIPLISFLLVFPGCALFVTMPNKIDSQYLRNKTASQQNKIEKIEKEIIKITNSKNSIDKKLKVNTYKKKISEKMVTRHKNYKEILDDKQRLYIIVNDSEKLLMLRNDIKRNNREYNTEKLKLKYYNANEKDLKALVELKDAELSYKVSQKLLIEAKIGRENQDKILGKTKKDPKDKKDNERINVKKYEEYSNTQKRNFEEKRKNQNKTKNLKKLALEKLKQAGFAEEL